MSELVWSDRRHVLGLPITFTKYYIKENKLYISEGLFNTTEDEILMYRILDIKLKSSFIDKIFGVGTLILYSADESNKTAFILKIKRSKEIRDLISGIAEDERARLRINGREIYGASNNSNHQDCDD